MSAGFHRHLSNHEQRRDDPCRRKWKTEDKPSVLEQLRALKAKVLSLTPDKSRNKDKGLEL